jgi:hypothetical protein
MGVRHPGLGIGAAPGARARVKRSRAILSSKGLRSAAMAIGAVLLILIVLPAMLVAAGT